MTFRARQPGCPCCDDDCRIDITGWEQYASFWDFTDFASITTDESGALLGAFPEHPEAKSTHYVSVKVKGDSDGDVLRVVVAFDGANNYLYAEIEVGTTCGYLRLFQVTSGSAFQLGDDIPSLDLTPSAFHAVRVCYDGETLTAIVVNKVAYSQDVAATGTYVGLATGAITTLATFNDFGWWIHYDEGDYYYGEPNDCPECERLPPCTISSDDFDQEDGTLSSCLWDVISGTPTVASGQLVFSGSAGEIVHKVPYPNEPVVLEVQALAASSGDSVRLFADNGSVYVEIVVHDDDDEAILRIGDSTGILESIATTAKPETLYTIKMCLVGSALSARTSVGNLYKLVTRGVDYKAGISGSTGSKFDNFLISEHRSKNPKCPNCAEHSCGCTVTQEGTDYHFCKPGGPCVWKVVLSGGEARLSDPDGCCDHNLNGTWIAAGDGDGFCNKYVVQQGQSPPCWQYRSELAYRIRVNAGISHQIPTDRPGDPPGLAFWQVFILLDYYSEAWFRWYVPLEDLEVESVNDAPDCWKIVDQELVLRRTIYTFGIGPCLFDNMTAKITAIGW